MIQLPSDPPTTPPSEASGGNTAAPATRRRRTGQPSAAAKAPKARSATKPVVPATEPPAPLATAEQAPAIRAAAVPPPKTSPKSAAKTLAPRKRTAPKTSPVASPAKAPAKGKPASNGAVAVAPPPAIKAQTLPAKVKLVRDSFTMPRDDFAVIDRLKMRMLELRRPVKKSEILRAGVHALFALSDAQLLKALDALAPLKVGRPKKG